MARILKISFLVMTLGLLIPAIAGWIVCGCAENKRDSVAQMSRTVDMLLGKQLNLDTDIGFFTTNGDSADTWLPQTRFTVLRYVGPEGCNTCRMKLKRYPDIISELSDQYTLSLHIYNSQTT